MQPLNYYREVVDTISEGNVVVAINNLKNHISTLQDWALMDECVTIEQTYHAMLRFYAEGAKDEHRDDVYCDILARLVDVAQRLGRKSKLKHETSLLYSKIRTVSHLARTLIYYTNRLKDIRQQALFLSIMDEANDEAEQSSRKLLDELFDHLWVAARLSKDDTAELRDMFASNYLTDNEKAWMVSALTLSALSYFDATKILLLGDVIAMSEGVVQCRAFVGVALVIMLHYKTITALHLDRKLDILKSHAHSSTWAMLQVMLFTTYNTRRIRKQFTDQIMPLISRLHAGAGTPENLIDILQDDEAQLPSGIDPSLIRKIHNRIQKVNDQATQGIDVYFEQFSQLKAYGFFYEVRNWFLPFGMCSEESHEQLRNLTALMGHSNLCDSDKHSLLATINMMPAQQMEFIRQQIKQLDILDANECNREIDQRLLANFNEQSSAMDFSHKPSPCLAYAPLYLQDLYRFFLIKMKGVREGNPFEAEPMLLFANHMMCDNMITPEESCTITMQAYGLKLYRHTLNLMPMCDEEDAERLLVIQALCHAALGEHPEAIDAFELHDINYGNMPSEARIVYANSLICDQLYERAVKVYESIPADEMIDVEGFATALFMLGRYDESLNLLFKEDFLNPDQPNIQRHIAHNLLYVNKPEEAMRYCGHLVSSPSPTVKDYLWAGHCQFAMGNMPQALHYYKKVLELEPHNSLFTTEDRELLQDLGVSAVSINLMGDAAANS